MSCAEHLAQENKKYTRARSSAKGWFVRTRWMYAKFMCSNHTNHTSYNHSHSRVNSRSRFEVSARISWSKVCVFCRHWQATTINNRFAIRFSSVLKIFTSFFLEMRYCSFLLTFCVLSVYLWAFSPFTFFAGFMSSAFPVLHNHSLTKA